MGSAITVVFYITKVDSSCTYSGGRYSTCHTNTPAVTVNNRKIVVINGCACRTPHRCHMLTFLLDCRNEPETVSKVAILRQGLPETFRFTGTEACCAS